ncbi:PucR family transcriptional regulator [Pseudonocardia humida]|uniref:PucR family transcriptional regulator n=1 Tax=Pseudonocardia humida TaxID=2800819 RepID=UPI0027E38D1D|nr:PucR family transcriptional regulator [Pseudonocardia humida]
MPLTLRDLCEDRGLGLRIAGPPADLDRPIGWVHASELDDPTPYLDGGELLLTVGLGPHAGTGPRDYVARLAAHGLSGLGFGTGLGYDEIPAAVVDACARAGLPLLEVPERTPFLALTKAVAAAHAADRYAEVVRTDEARRALTAAALSTGVSAAGPAGVTRRGAGGTANVLAALAERLDAWVLVCDGDGRVRHAVPRSAARRASGLGEEIAKVRDHAGRSCVSMSDGARQVVLQPVRLLGPAVLVVGRNRPFTPVDQRIVEIAVSVLTLSHTRSAAVGRAERRLRTAVLRALLTLPGGGAEQVLADTWDPLPEGPVVVVAFGGRLSGPLPPALLDALDRAAPGFHAELDDRVVAVVPGETDDAVAAALAPAARHPDVRAGVSDPAPPGELDRALREATRALDAADRRDRPVVRFADLAAGGLADLVPPADAAAFAASVLAPLLRHDAERRGDLVGSLREWLAHHGQWDPAAARLGVHRHTLRARMAKAAALLERDLDSPGVRAELWFALHLPG